jgi:hypothetical protein
MALLGHDPVGLSVVGTPYLSHAATTVWITDDEHGRTCLDTGNLICTHAS